MLHPDYPVQTGNIRCTEEWALNLPFEVNRRVEEDEDGIPCLVLWRPRFTIWIDSWGTDDGDMEGMLNHRLAIRSPDAFDLRDSTDSVGVRRCAYRLDEDRGEAIVHALYAFAAARESLLTLSFYFDDIDDTAPAWEVLNSTRFSSTEYLH